MGSKDAHEKRAQQAQPAYAKLENTVWGARELTVAAAGGRGAAGWLETHLPVALRGAGELERGADQV